MKKCYIALSAAAVLTAMTGLGGFLCGRASVNAPAVSADNLLHKRQERDKVLELLSGGMMPNVPEGVNRSSSSKRTVDPK